MPGALRSIESTFSKVRFTRFDPWGHARTQFGFVVQTKESGRVLVELKSCLAEGKEHKPNFFTDRFHEMHPRIPWHLACLKFSKHIPQDEFRQNGPEHRAVLRFLRWNLLSARIRISTCGENENLWWNNKPSLRSGIIGFIL